jgi:hypothetical protein
MRLGEGSDFTIELSYEAHSFKFTKNCHTKYETATFAKPLLAVRSFSLSCWLGAVACRLFCFFCVGSSVGKKGNVPANALAIGDVFLFLSA